MQVKYELTKCNNKTSVALGCFDGVHKGHIQVIKNAVQSSLTSCIFTFSNDPQNFFLSTKIPQICSHNQKINLFKNLGVNLVFCIPFKNIFKLSDVEFVDEVLVKKLNAKTVVCGFNYHFGFSGTSDTLRLKHICKEKNISVKIIPPVIDKQNPISSTRIRSLIKNGDVKSAGILLGRNFCIEAKIKKIDKEFVFQKVDKQQIIPKSGVYLSNIKTKEHSVDCQIKVFKQNNEVVLLPSVSQHQIKNLYEKNVEINFIDYVKRSF